MDIYAELITIYRTSLDGYMRLWKVLNLSYETFKVTADKNSINIMLPKSTFKLVLKVHPQV